MEKSRPSVRLSDRPTVLFFSSLGNGVAWQQWGQRCVSCLEPGPRVLVHVHNKCFMERKRLCFRMDEVSGQLQLVSTAEKLCLGSSVYACAKCVCAFVCLCACVHVCVLVSCLFLWCSHRGASRNIFSPLWQHFPAERQKEKFDS